jgi:hypothetical protein
MRSKKLDHGEHGDTAMKKHFQGFAVSPCAPW